MDIYPYYIYFPSKQILNYKKYLFKTIYCFEVVVNTNIVYYSIKQVY